MNKITAVAKVQGSDVYVTFISCSNSEIGVANGAVHEFSKLGHTVDPNKVSFWNLGRPSREEELAYHAAA